MPALLVFLVIFRGPRDESRAASSSISGSRVTGRTVAG
jgi:hypothetical protein